MNKAAVVGSSVKPLCLCASLIHISNHLFSVFIPTLISFSFSLVLLFRLVYRNR